MTKRVGIYLRAVGNVAVILFLALAVTGCAFSTYKAKMADAPAKPDNYPIPVYTEQMKIPRPCDVMGTVTFTAGKLTMFGGSSEKQLVKILQMARAKGADVVRIMNVEKPDFANPNYRLTAQLLHYADAWETVPFTRKSLQAYLNAQAQQLDPIEGVWLSDIIHGLTIGIVKDNSKTNRDFIGFVLESANPAWMPGMKKIDIRHGTQPNGYVLTYYLDDFAPRDVQIILARKNKFAISIYSGEDSEDQDIVTYSKFQ
jgi:hypothetical protein